METDTITAIENKEQNMEKEDVIKSTPLAK